MVIEKNIPYTLGVNLVYVVDVCGDLIKVRIPKRNLNFVWSKDEFIENINEGIISKLEL